MKLNINFLQSLKSPHQFLLNIKILFVLGLLFVSGLTHADINSVVSSPSSISVPARGATNLNVTWRVNRTETAIGGGAFTRTVSSSAAELQINGSTVATLAGVISKSSTLFNPNSETLTFNETYSLTAALARRIASSPAGSVRVTRLFTDTQRAGTGNLRLFTGSANSGPLTVRKIDLTFENQARTDVVYKDDAVHAIADISFRSSGILKGEWRIIDPTASLGSSGGRVLKVIRQNLVSSGEGRTRIVSPPLPTNGIGLYFVSLVLLDANTNFVTPILRYFVLDNTAKSLTSAPSIMTVRSPGDGADLNDNTVFIWEGVEGAQAYQVELFNKGDNLPLTGKLVPKTDLKLSLSSFSLEWLKPGHEYTWRVRAFGMGGTLLAQSEHQSIYMP
jgi:hypothetical protein